MQVREMTITWRAGADHLEFQARMDEETGIDERAGLTQIPLSDPGVDQLVRLFLLIASDLNKRARLREKDNR